MTMSMSHSPECRIATPGQRYVGHQITNITGRSSVDCHGLLLLASCGAHSRACTVSTPVYDLDHRNCTAIFLALFGHSTGRDASHNIAYPSLDPVDEAVVVNQILLFQYLYRSKDELGEGLG